MRAVAFTASLFASTAAQAEVKSATASGFVVESRAVVAVPPAVAYAMLTRVGAWWIPSHTYSGKGASLSLDPRAGGCFCESWAGGSVEHGRVIAARPGQQLRLSGALGPLQGEALTGTLTWTLKPAPNGTEIVQTYSVAAYVAGGADKYASPVDQVMAQQLAAFTKALAR
jgi:uncharacterized protein YndB with AHSA1/START domain